MYISCKQLGTMLIKLFFSEFNAWLFMLRQVNISLQRSRDVDLGIFERVERHVFERVRECVVQLSFPAEAASNDDA